MYLYRIQKKKLIIGDRTVSRKYIKEWQSQTLYFQSQYNKKVYSTYQKHALAKIMFCKKMEQWVSKECESNMAQQVL